ncbi:tripartite tricarboxylate transporter substrate binding protein [Achromobacter sp. F4_2707]|uniref:Bug family tripartite tricarboxylate transporter substrate binding protein n=1 Tax=Achromobacter sp. F4_2707 TaxID=3114286 RepID=UPI0039C68C27
MKMQRYLGAAAVLLAGLIGTSAHAETNYPSQPIKLVVPFGPGGVTDLTGRTYAHHMSEVLNGTIVVENRAGAGATIGANHVAKAPADGYTMLLGTNVTHAINPQLMQSVPYDPLKDFQAIGLFGTNGNVLIVRDDFPANNFGEFIALMKEKKDEANYASGSVGSSAHLAAELLKQEVEGLDYMHVPYGGPSEAMSALIGGHVDFSFANIGAAVSQIQSGRIKALAVTTSQRVDSLPDVPTISEAGVPGFEVIGWIAAFAPKGVSPEIIERLHAALEEAKNNPALQKTLDVAALVRPAATPEDVTKFVNAEYEKWGRVIREGNIAPIN